MFPTPLTFMFRAWTTFKNRKCLNVAPHLGLASWTILCKVSRARSQSTMENKIKRFPILVWKIKVSKNYFLIFPSLTYKVFNRPCMRNCFPIVQWWPMPPPLWPTPQFCLLCHTHIHPSQTFKAHPANIRTGHWEQWTKIKIQTI